MDCDLGITGLATMGANLARNGANHGFTIAVHNRSEGKTDLLMREHGGDGADGGSLVATRGTDDFIAALKRPRAIVMMVKAGKPVDDVIAELAPKLEPGDILIDGGNSLFSDTQRRGKALEATGIRYIGMGVSGGEVGALEGPSMMPGGDAEAYERIRPIVEKMAAQVEGEPCCAFLGSDGAGHYVKMVHNGIEYADMQLIAESYDLMRSAYGLDAATIADTFLAWNGGELDSYLIQITAEVLRKVDPQSKRPLVDVILDEAEQKGTGSWTAEQALHLGIPVTAIAEAVFARSLSARKGERVAASKALHGPSAARRDADASALDDLRDALFAAKIVAYAQGFDQLGAASKEFDWKLDLGTIARIWRGGCIIRAKFLDRIREAYAKDASLTNLLLMPYFHDAFERCEPALRRVVTLSVEHGIPIPAFSSALAYFDGFRRAAGPANLIQGLRDYFGSHTYRRTDVAGTFHILWSEGGAEVKTSDTPPLEPANV